MKASSKYAIFTIVQFFLITFVCTFIYLKKIKLYAYIYETVLDYLITTVFVEQPLALLCLINIPNKHKID